jgi:hypothetical protein
MEAERERYLEGFRRAGSQNRAALDVRLTTEDVTEFDRWFLPRPSKRPLLVV